MVVPWVGFELADLLKKVGVQPSAKYVAFETAVLPDVMPGVRYGVLDWPYREGLRLDEQTLHSAQLDPGDARFEPGGRAPDPAVAFREPLDHPEAHVVTGVRVLAPRIAEPHHDPIRNRPLVVDGRWRAPSTEPA